ncbi:FMN-binding negative transcriptional regulator [Pseudoflavitalea sp. X16]|uniref:FMN-binding negative transcriptional regulator n=1 Tax=Paraflavitalea devenefica TaxID=2716334 RepID=UPI00142239DF|nr:FMN-binding negative transcriptional regulator [Paraflavitalea devenefica]NII28545.1 FMN-binding negative transcriptional regulator [Paraflavitalea devenefica]
MFIPNAFKFEDTAGKIAFMKRYSFATIVTCKDQMPIATQLPFVVDESAGSLRLCAHLAAANEQAKYIETNTSLVIFSEPHAYISPKHYDKRESVPTWDYIAIHAYGRARIIEDEMAKLKALEQMIHFYEQDYMEQWQGLSDKFKKGMMQGIVAFEIEVTDLQGQQKLSQNKTVKEREKIIQQLEKSTDSVQKDLAPFIRNLSK